MSSPSLQHESHSAAHEPQDAATTNSGVSMLTNPVKTVGFWTAVALPFLHIPLLFTGLESASETTTFLALIALNIIALVVGRSYNRD